MGQPYRRASHTIAWLGPATASSDVAVRFLWRTSYNDSLTPSVSELNSLEALCSHTYFQRLWVVPEVVLSRRLDFLCGVAICSWDNFVLFRKQLYYTKPFAFFTDGEIRGTYKARTLNDVSKELIDTKREVTLGFMRQHPLAYLLRLSARRYCSNFHDRVYALLGLFAESRSAIDFEVDYSISREELMIRTERFLNLDTGEYFEAAYAHYILKAFQPQITVEVLGKVAWYWKISEVLHNLRINVFGSFERLDTLSSFQDRTLTLQVICWIVSGYGIELFSAAENDDEKAPISYETSHLTYCWSDAIKNRKRKRIFNMSRAYHLGTRSYHIEMSHLANEPCSLHIPEGFVATEKRSIKWRKLLRRYNPDVRIVENMQRQAAPITDEEATEVDSRTSGHFP